MQLSVAMWVSGIAEFYIDIPKTYCVAVGKIHKNMFTLHLRIWSTQETKTQKKEKHKREKNTKESKIYNRKRKAVQKKPAIWSVWDWIAGYCMPGSMDSVPYRSIRQILVFHIDLGEKWKRTGIWTFPIVSYKYIQIKTSAISMSQPLSFTHPGSCRWTRIK